MHRFENFFDVFDKFCVRHVFYALVLNAFPSYDSFNQGVAAMRIQRRFAFFFLRVSSPSVPVVLNASLFTP